MRGPLRVLSGAMVLTCAAIFQHDASQPPDYEAHAVVQIRPARDLLPVLESRLLTRDALAATAARQGVPGPDGALRLTQAIGLHALTTSAGVTLGLAPETIGVTLSVQLPDGQMAMRVANDLALQLMDLGSSGQLDPSAERLGFYRAEEDRLQQEIAALKTSGGTDRQITLLQDQYDTVRKGLAEAEVSARLETRIAAAPFALLSRASVAEPLAPPHLALREGLAVGAVVLAALSLALGRRLPLSLPSRPERRTDSARSRSS